MVSQTLACSLRHAGAGAETALRRSLVSKPPAHHFLVLSVPPAESTRECSLLDRDEPGFDQPYEDRNDREWGQRAQEHAHPEQHEYHPGIHWVPTVGERSVNHQGRRFFERLDGRAATIEQPRCNRGKRHTGGYGNRSQVSLRRPEHSGHGSEVVEPCHDDHGSPKIHRGVNSSLAHAPSLLRRRSHSGCLTPPAGPLPSGDGEGWLADVSGPRDGIVVQPPFNNMSVGSSPWERPCSHAARSVYRKGSPEPVVTCKQL